jgi:hypothetical protein
LEGKGKKGYKREIGVILSDYVDGNFDVWLLS